MDIFIVLIVVMLIVVYVNIYQLYNLNMSSLCVFSRACLFAAPWTVACQAPLSMGFARILEWIAISSSRFFTIEPPGNLRVIYCKPTMLQ